MSYNYGMIYRNTDQEINSSLFLTSSANWEAVVKAKDHTSAATKAIEYVFEQDKDMKISPTVMVMDLSSKKNQENNLDDFEFVYAPQALSDAGLHKVSKLLTKIIENSKE